MVRTLDLAEWAGQWVALDQNDVVVCDAETIDELLVLLKAACIEGASVVRAPVPGEPVVFGLG
jgi:hypothetical protein